MTEYCTAAELKAYLRITDTAEDTQLSDSIITASRAVDHYCGRRFFADSGVTARVYKPDTIDMVTVDDFQTTVGLIVQVDTADTATFSYTLPAANYELEPFNNIVDGEPGWPYNRIRSLNCEFILWNRRKASVQVTAKWGWAAVPGPVKQATIYLAEEAYKLKGSPFGVANFDQFGPIRVRDNPKVMAMLAPYRLNPVLVG